MQPAHKGTISLREDKNRKTWKSRSETEGASRSVNGVGGWGGSIQVKKKVSESVTKIKPFFLIF